MKTWRWDDWKKCMWWEYWTKWSENLLFFSVYNFLFGSQFLDAIFNVWINWRLVATSNLITIPANFFYCNLYRWIVFGMCIKWMLFGSLVKRQWTWVPRCSGTVLVEHATKASALCALSAKDDSRNVTGSLSPHTLKDKGSKAQPQLEKKVEETNFHFHQP